MQSLSPEVIRADDETRAVYQDGMLKVVEQVAKGLRGFADRGSTQASLDAAFRALGRRHAGPCRP